MTSALLVKTKTRFLNNPHTWVIIFISLFLVFVYQAWPWREWQFDQGVWQWFRWLSPLYNMALVETANHIIGILFFIPIIYAAAVLSWQGALFAYLISLAAVLPIIISIWPTSYIVTNITILLIPLFTTSVIAFEVARRRKERETYAEREVERQIYISKIMESQESERQRIAQEIHDDTIQTLLVIANRAQEMIPASAGKMSEVKRSSEWIRDTTLRAVEELRRTSLDLRPSILDDLGLVPALRWLVDRMNKDSDIRTDIIIDGEKSKLSPLAEVTIFRVIQEALNNIKRHSEATEAVVTLEFAAESLRITIKDNGQGFRPPKNLGRLATKGKLGLVGMQQRVDSLGGKFRIHSIPGEGTVLTIGV